MTGLKAWDWWYDVLLDCLDDGGDVASAALFRLVEVQKCSSLLTQTVGPLSPRWADMKLDWFTLASRKGFCTSKTAVNSELNPHRKQHSSTLHLAEKKQSLIVRGREVGYNITLCVCYVKVCWLTWHIHIHTHAHTPWSLSVGSDCRFSVYR